MPLTVTSADSIVAEDPSRAAISAITGRDQATIKFTPTNDGTLVPDTTTLVPDGGLFPDEFLVPSDYLYPDDGLLPGGGPDTILACRIEEGGGTAPFTGRKMANVGLVCSDSEPCTDDGSLLCADWNVAMGQQQTVVLTYAETGAPADGPETIYVWVAVNRGQGYT